ncbi:hypothetical protein [Nonomuraea sp. NPDC050691]|uniref:hypothetical protein n=1 Tax=Nonomuraea sp. NPDC050691 TaxID=3155661 RepID=UPI0033C0A713
MRPGRGRGRLHAIAVAVEDRRVAAGEAVLFEAEDERERMIRFLEGEQGGGTWADPRFQRWWR